MVGSSSATSQRLTDLQGSGHPPQSQSHLTYIQAAIRSGWYTGQEAPKNGFLGSLVFGGYLSYAQSS